MSIENPLYDDHMMFVTNLAIGRVTQTVFEQMLRNAFHYFVAPFGYEYTHPDLVNSNNKPRPNINRGWRRFSSQPDFKLYPMGYPEKVNLVEVKYRSNLDKDDIFTQAKTIKGEWPNTHLFVATPEDFYMDTCEIILENKGSIRLFTQSGFINRPSRRIVDKYHKILRGILGTNDTSGHQGMLTQTVEDPLIVAIRKIIQG